MKHITAILMILALLLCLTACGPEPAPPEAPALDEARVLEDLNTIDPEIMSLKLEKTSSSFTANDKVSGKLKAEFSNGHIVYTGSYNVKYEDVNGQLRYVSSTADTDWRLAEGCEFTRTALEEYLGKTISNTSCVSGDKSCTWYYDDAIENTLYHRHLVVEFDPVSNEWCPLTEEVDSTETLVELSDLTGSYGLFLHKEHTVTGDGSLVFKAWPVGIIQYSNSDVNKLNYYDQLKISKYTDDHGSKYSNITLDYWFITGDEYSETWILTDPHVYPYYTLSRQRDDSSGRWTLYKYTSAYQHEPLTYLKSEVHVMLKPNTPVVKWDSFDGKGDEDIIDVLGLFKRAKCYGMLVSADIKKGVIEYMEISEAVK